MNVVNVYNNYNWHVLDIVCYDIMKPSNKNKVGVVEFKIHFLNENYEYLL